MLKQTELTSFIFTNKMNGRIVVVKKSAEMDLHFTTGEIDCFQFNVLQLQSQKNGYNLEKGFFNLAELNSESEIKGNELLKKKVEFLMVFKININLINRGIKARLDPSFSIAITEDIEQRKVIDEFIQEEKDLLKNECDRFFSQLIQKVGQVKNNDQIEELELYLKNNVNLGYFSIISQSGE